jgi:hypothetical protein
MRSPRRRGEEWGEGISRSGSSAGTRGLERELVHGWRRRSGTNRSTVKGAVTVRLRDSSWPIGKSMAQHSRRRGTTACVFGLLLLLEVSRGWDGRMCGATSGSRYHAVRVQWAGYESFVDYGVTGFPRGPEHAPPRRPTTAMRRAVDRPASRRLPSLRKPRTEGPRRLRGVARDTTERLELRYRALPFRCLLMCARVTTTSNERFPPSAKPPPTRSWGDTSINSGPWQPRSTQELGAPLPGTYLEPFPSVWVPSHPILLPHPGWRPRTTWTEHTEKACTRNTRVSLEWIRSARFEERPTSKAPLESTWGELGKTIREGYFLCRF